MFGLARELYGGTPWMMHGRMFAAYAQVLSDERSNKNKEYGEKLNYISFAEISSKKGPEIFTKGYDEYGNPLRPKENSVAVTFINGPITKGGGMSSRGMKEIASSLVSLDADPNIIGHIVQIDSGGGSSTGMEVMAHAIKSLKKPVVGLVERAGMAASAAYGILSHTDWAMAEDANSEVGSIGTMISFSGFPANQKDEFGQMHVTAYATASTMKNKAFEEAVNTGKTELLVSELLDPFNERFLANTKAQRPNILDTQLDGSMYNAGDVVGTMVDQIGSFSDAINKILELSKSNNTFNKNSNKKSTAMTAEEIKAQFPDAHAAIYGAGLNAGTTAGIDAEQERVKSWQVFAAVDPEAVQKGIESGKAIAQSEVNSFLLKASSKNQLEKLKDTSAAAVITPEAGASAELTPEAVAHAKEVENIFGDYFKKN